MKNIVAKRIVPLRKSWDANPPTFADMHRFLLHMCQLLYVMRVCCPFPAL